jgi:hypothetical protein
VIRHPQSDNPVCVDQAWIKAQAQKTGRPVTAFLALARQNDPFYVGTPASRAQGEWFANLWQRGGFGAGVHLRRMHYWCTAQTGLTLATGEPYANTDKCWQYLCQASKAARYLNLVPISDICDRKNPEPHVVTAYQSTPSAQFEIDTPEFAHPYVYVNSGNGFNPSMVQPYHLEVWVEKSTMNDVLLPVCPQFQANLVTGEGEMTISAVYDLVRRIQAARKPARIFYISDFDPAGYSMPCAVARKIEFLARSQQLDIDVKLRRLLLNREHVDGYHLPRIPIKESERRATRFQANHGEGCVELDALEALHPGTLVQVVTGALARFYSRDAERKARLKEDALRQAIHERVSAITARYQEQIQALHAMNQELSELTVPEIEQYEPERAQAVADEGTLSWLLDTDRDYMAQIVEYKSYARGDAEEEVA